jgi:hypothetical protein
MFGREKAVRELKRDQKMVIKNCRKAPNSDESAKRLQRRTNERYEVRILTTQTTLINKKNGNS